MSNRVVIIVDGGIAEYINDLDVDVLLLDVDMWKQSGTGYTPEEVEGFEDLIPEWVKHDFLIDEEEELKRVILPLINNNL